MLERALPCHTALTIADAERAVFRIEPVVKGQNCMAGRGTEGLDRVTVSFGEEPEIPWG